MTCLSRTSDLLSSRWRKTDSRYTRADRLKIAYKLTRHVKPNLLLLACRRQVSCNDPQLDNARLKPAVGFKMSAAAYRKRRHWKRTVNILFFKMKTKCICCYCVLCSLQYIIYNLQGRGCCTDWLYWSANTGMSTIKSRTFVEDGKQESSQTAPLRHQATPPLQRGCSVAAAAEPLGHAVAKRRTFFRPSTRTLVPVQHRRRSGLDQEPLVQLARRKVPDDVWFHGTNRKEWTCQGSGSCSRFRRVPASPPLQRIKYDSAK